MGNFHMNAILVSGGYPWTVLHIERRDDYMQGLEKASVYQDIIPFTNLINQLFSGKI